MKYHEKLEKFGLLYDVKRKIEKTLKYPNWTHVKTMSLSEIDFFNLSDDFISGIKAALLEVDRNIDIMIENATED